MIDSLIYGSGYNTDYDRNVYNDYDDGCDYEVDKKPISINFSYHDDDCNSDRSDHNDHDRYEASVFILGTSPRTESPV